MLKKCILIFFCFSMTSIAWCADTIKLSLVPETPAKDLFNEFFGHTREMVKHAVGFVGHTLYAAPYLFQGTLKIVHNGIVFAQNNPAIVMTCVGVYGIWRAKQWWAGDPKKKQKRR